MAVSNLETISTEDQKKVDHQSDHQNQILQQDEANEQTDTPLSLKAMIEGLIFIAGEDGLSLYRFNQFSSIQPGLKSLRSLTRSERV